MGDDTALLGKGTITTTKNEGRHGEDGGDAARSIPHVIIYYHGTHTNFLNNNFH